MIRRAFVILLCAVLLAPAIAMAQDAKAFLGDWVLTVEGRRGPQERPLTIKDTGGKLQRGAGRRPRRSGDHHRRDREGQRGDAEVEPGDAAGRHRRRDDADVEGRRADVKQDFAGGQFSQTGTGKKKG